MKFSENHVEVLARRMTYAGKMVREIYESGDFGIKYKQDSSPLTKADILANQILTEGILELFPNDYVVSEEDKVSHNLKNRTKFWLIDPIDGTKEFINKTGEFTLNIGYIENGFPVWGMVYAPIQDELYYGGKDYDAFYRFQRHTLPIAINPHFSKKAFVSRNHQKGQEDVVLGLLGISEKIPMGSSLKLCKIAEGMADIYLRMGETSEWDTAAADAILRAVHGGIFDFQSKPLVYGKEKLANPPFYAVSYGFIKHFGSSIRI